MAIVTYEETTRAYPGAERPAVNSLQLRIDDGEFLVLVGPSGCGKSTSLRMLAGLEDVDDGAIFIGDRDVTDLAPRDRDIAMVFQNYALYPHMSVADNMGFALKIAGVAKGERRRRVADAAVLLDLEPYLDRKPKALSGGQRQRVAMGRAIVGDGEGFGLTVNLIEELGSDAYVYGTLDGCDRRLGDVDVIARVDSRRLPAKGDRMNLRVRPGETHVFSTQTGQRLSA
ncbi:MAG: ATP-binding cassette domain-containing protein [Actinophytocola sp.]|nr:ATP-binding cassette domain-containing protein [Actinophytocola sp.]